MSKIFPHWCNTVSYTHLDVYKRQVKSLAMSIIFLSMTFVLALKSLLHLQYMYSSFSTSLLCRDIIDRKEAITNFKNCFIGTLMISICLIVEYLVFLYNLKYVLSLVNLKNYFRYLTINRFYHLLRIFVILWKYLVNQESVKTTVVMVLIYSLL